MHSILGMGRLLVSLLEFGCGKEMRRTFSLTNPPQLTHRKMQIPRLHPWGHSGASAATWGLHHSGGGNKASVGGLARGLQSGYLMSHWKLIKRREKTVSIKNKGILCLVLQVGSQKAVLTPDSGHTIQALWKHCYSGWAEEVAQELVKLCRQKSPSIHLLRDS